MLLLSAKKLIQRKAIISEDKTLILRLNLAAYRWVSSPRSGRKVLDNFDCSRKNRTSWFRVLLPPLNFPHNRFYVRIWHYIVAFKQPTTELKSVGNKNDILPIPPLDLKLSTMSGKPK